MTLNRNHQTAVFFRVPADPTYEYRERTKRLADSLNRTGDGQSTIKADLYSVTPDGNIVSGLDLDASTSPELSSPELSADVREQVEAAGFDLVPNGTATTPSLGTAWSDADLQRYAAEAGYVMTSVVNPTV